MTAIEIKALLIGHGLTWFAEWYELTGNASNYVITMDSRRAIAPTGGFEQGFFFPMVQLMKGKTPIVWPVQHAEKPFEQSPWI